MSWIPTMQPRSISSRHASSRSFSKNGSPTCTVGRLLSVPSSKLSLAIVAPWIPSRPGARADVVDRVADTGRAPEEDSVLLHDAEAERVDEAVLIVARMEARLAADGRDADAVAVAADAVHDAPHELLRPRCVPPPEAERVEQRESGGRPS
jgi:hypothetical protein